MFYNSHTIGVCCVVVVVDVLHRMIAQCYQQCSDVRLYQAIVMSVSVRCVDWPKSVVIHNVLASW